jgi:predicted SAM-dependent methyltransferase
MKAINLGAGEVVIAGVESQDVDEKFKSDHCFDLKQFPWPLESESYDEVYFFHCIEHIEKRYHKFIFSEIWRILKPEGTFIVSFPEFEIILRYWLMNHQGQREHWEHNIYGLQRTKSDYHVCAMDATETRDLLFYIGFKDLQIGQEEHYYHNTVIRGLKGQPMKSYEEVVYEDVIK